jgi:hypothetical protein
MQHDLSQAAKQWNGEAFIYSTVLISICLFRSNIICTNQTGTFLIEGLVYSCIQKN